MVVSHNDFAPGYRLEIVFLLQLHAHAMDDELDRELAEFFINGDGSQGSRESALSVFEPSTQDNNEVLLPRIITYAQWIHCTYVDGGKEKRTVPTITLNRGASHPLAPIIAQVVTSFCSSSLATLTNNTHGFCAQVRLSYHEPHTSFESCCKDEDCAHLSVSLHRNPLGGDQCHALEHHEVVKIADLTSDQMQEYRTIVHRMKELLNPNNAAPIRGQAMALAATQTARA